MLVPVSARSFVAVTVLSEIDTVISVLDSHLTCFKPQKMSGHDPLVPSCDNHWLSNRDRGARYEASTNSESGPDPRDGPAARDLVESYLINHLSIDPRTHGIELGSHHLRYLTSKARPHDP
jgi:hypothetical protein